MCILLASVYKMGNLCSVKWSFLIIHNWSCRSTIALCCGNMRPLRLVSAYISYYISFFNEMTRVLMKQFPDMVNPGMTMYDPFICKKVWNRILSFILSTKYWLFIKWVPNTPEPIWMWLWFNNQRVWLPKQRHGLNIHEPYVQEVFKIGCTHCMCRVFCGNVYIYNVEYCLVLNSEEAKDANPHWKKQIIIFPNWLLRFYEMHFCLWHKWALWKDGCAGHLINTTKCHGHITWRGVSDIPWGLFMPFHRLVGCIKWGLAFAYWNR